jgi:hypothetical protein
MHAHERFPPGAASLRNLRNDATRKCGRCGASAAERPDWGRYERNGILKPFCPECYASGRIKQTSGKHRCKQCGRLAAKCPDWGRYEKNGRLKVLCPECDRQEHARREQQQRLKAIAAAAGYERGWASTPDYHRLQRERHAARDGRALEPYVPQEERNRIGRMIDADHQADQIRAQWIRHWLKRFRKSDRELYREDAEYRAQKQAAYRASYARRREFERARSRAWNTSHPQERLAQQDRRNERVLNGSDGTASVHAISRLKQQATHCAYCARPLTRKQTDHMTPVVLGGAHSLRNVVIVCPECNGRKGKLSYPEWIERVAPEHRGRVIALYLDRYGAVAA